MKMNVVILSALITIVSFMGAISGYAQESQGSIGVEGRIGSAAPARPPTIAVPRPGQVFTQLPVTVSGLCPEGELVKLFKNNVFAGSAPCLNGSYSVTIDLFSGTNELVARVFDALDQAGPDSATVSVTFNDSRPGLTNRPTLTSNFAKRGANPNETLRWPIVLSGGQGPYAVSVDWGDGKPADLFTRDFPGSFDIEHVYEQAGTYNIIIRAADTNDSVAYIQLVGIANGALSQTSETGSGQQIIERTKIIWKPFLVLIPLLLLTFWLGRKYQLLLLRQRMLRRE